MQHNLLAHNLAHKVTILQGYSNEVLPELIEHEWSFSLVFVDGNHDVWPRYDVEHAVRVLEPKGFVAVHDYGEPNFPAIQKACDDLVSEPHKLIDTLWIAQKEQFQ
jgi:hypothetical protein